MSLKLKVLGLGLLAVMATSAFAVMNAGATTGGHFTNDASGGHASVIGTESTNSTHRLGFVRVGGGPEDEISCHNASYTGTVNAASVQSVSITPAWSNCTTGTTGTATSFEVHEGDCFFTFTGGKIGESHHTADVVCGKSAGFTITHPNCHITVPPQTVRGITYTTTVENNKHAITMNVTVGSITSNYEGGICIFLGTNQKSEMNGSVTVKATDTNNNPVNITETTG